MKGTVVVAGSLAQKPRKGGHTWVLLQYLLGFRDLGWDVLFLDRLDPGMCRDLHGFACGFRESVNVEYFLDVMKSAKLDDAFALDYDSGKDHIGLSRSEVLDRVRSAQCFLNVMGYCTDREVLSCTRNAVFLDIDPGFPQMWHELRLADLFSGHGRHVTVGVNIGCPDSAIPTCGFEWITTAPPVVLNQWPQLPPSGNTAFTTIGAWRGSYGPLDYQGKRYGLRVHEFRKFSQLPRLTGRAFHVALDIHEGDGADRESLAADGWVLVDPLAAAADPWSYQKHIQESKAEIMIAKNMYVESKSGWFSDRSVCYLATGRPVLVQDTGLSGNYPVGQGIVTFKTLEEAAAGVEEICSDYDRHSHAARKIAEEYFDSRKVLTALLDKVSD